MLAKKRVSTFSSSVSFTRKNPKTASQTNPLISESHAAPLPRCRTLCCGGWPAARPWHRLPSVSSPLSPQIVRRFFSDQNRPMHSTSNMFNLQPNHCAGKNRALHRHTTGTESAWMATVCAIAITAHSFFFFFGFLILFSHPQPTSFFIRWLFPPPGNDPPSIVIVVYDPPPATPPTNDSPHQLPFLFHHHSQGYDQSCCDLVNTRYDVSASGKGGIL